MPIRRPAILAATAVLALLAVAGPGTRPASAQTAIKVVVNGEPITSNEINQRARFLRLVAKELSGPALQKQAMEELIDEKLKAAEAKRVKVTITEAQVDAAFAGIAERVKLAPSQLGQALAQQGIDARTLRARLRGQLTWQQLVLNRFSKSVTITDSQIIAALEKKGANRADLVKPTKTDEFLISQITFVVAKSTPGGAAARLKEAEAFRARLNGCDGLNELARSYKEVVIKNVGRRTAEELPEGFRKPLTETPVGKATKPQAGGAGVELLAVCEKREVQTDIQDRGKVENDLREQEGQLLARQYISELRRIAVIDYK
ncbi:SurA N-terminal domain-containing protein [Prosthecomicrobium sp. N25]|uniref:SurA N-terminal domain-containing protein n=1 Tax=Prosthecomicrobium sp. N25 TaxID=3129254 RepID=UPI003077AC11